MNNLLARTITELLEAGLTPEELALYTAMSAEDVSTAAGGGDAPSITVEGAIGLGRISYLLEQLKRTGAGAERIELIVRAEAVEVALERYLLGEPAVAVSVARAG